VTSTPSPRRRVGVLGGTFDPPHMAHLALAAAARTALLLDRVVFVVAGDPWRKNHRRVSPAASRLEMVRTAIEPFDWAEVSTVEVDRDGPSYTADTLAALVRPDEDWWFILGADALADMPAWHEPQRIIELARLAVTRRPDVDGELIPSALREALPHIEERVDMVEMSPLDISATDIRRRVRAGESTEFLLPESVRAVVDRLGLYRDSD
jgi:nicotinate-nucleotide adenylyltransferase